MGSIMGKAMEQQGERQSEMMGKMQKDTMERQIEMQNYMREVQMAMSIARSRDLFNYWAAFYGVATVGCLAGAAKRKHPAPLVPLVPLGFIVAYLYDLAHGSKIQRMKNEASHILQEERGLLDIPVKLPSIQVLEDRRLRRKDD